MVTNEYMTTTDANEGGEGDPSYGGGPAAPKPPVEQAIDCIANSDWAKTEEGKKILAKIKELRDKIQSGNPPGAENARGTYNPATGVITYNPSYNNDPGSIASELVHEAAHAVWDDTHAHPNPDTIDEELYTNLQQLAFYDGQNGDCKPKDTTELDRRRGLRDRGGDELRDDIRIRYPSYGTYNP